MNKRRVTKPQRLSVLLAVLVLTLTVPWAVLAQVEVITNDQPMRVFAGESCKLAVALRNRTRQDFNADVSLRLLQTSSATAIPISVTHWKRLRLLPDQLVTEAAIVNIPEVRSATWFLVQWLEGTNHILGSTVVMVYPTNLLSQLKTLAGGDPLGVFDPANQLKSLLRPLAVEFQDLQEEGTDKYIGKLAIFGPFESRSQMRASFKDDIRALARRGVAVVWLQPPPDKRATLKPSFYAVPEGESTVVVAAHELVAGLAERPEAQLNLLRLAEESLHPTRLTLPETETSN